MKMNHKKIIFGIIMVVISLLILIFAIADDDAEMFYVFNPGNYEFAFDSCVGGITPNGEIYSKEENVLKMPKESLDWILRYDTATEECQLGLNQENAYEVFDTESATIYRYLDEGMLYTTWDTPTKYTVNDVQSGKYYVFPRTKALQTKKSDITVCYIGDEIKLEYNFKNKNPGLIRGSIEGVYGHCYHNSNTDEYGVAYIVVARGCSGEYVCKGEVAGLPAITSFIKNQIQNGKIIKDYCLGDNGGSKVIWQTNNLLTFED
jgi:hypothetical protein